MGGLAKILNTLGIKPSEEDLNEYLEEVQNDKL